jgi:hypothetical protein
MASAFYNLALQEFWKASMGDMTSVSVKCRLMRTSAYTFSQAHQYLTSLPATIVSDVTLGTKAANGGGGADPGCFDAADAVFTSVTAGAAIDCLAVYRDTGTGSTSNLLFYIDGFSVTPNGGDITIQWQNSAPWVAKL